MLLPSLLLALAAQAPTTLLPKRALAVNPENALVILVDDWGLDMLESYGTPDLSAQCITRPPTPNIDALAESGITFLSAWVQPVCSPTRASLLTGRHAFRHKIGRIVDQCQSGGSGGPCPPVDALADSEFTIPEMLHEAAQVGLLPSYGTAAVGKWHLGPDPIAPLIQGFDRFRGSQHNIQRTDAPNETYCSWLKNTDGTFSMSTTYATTDAVDEALSFINDQGDEPWFLYVAMHSGHAPWHIPPPHLAPSYFINDGVGGCFHAQDPSCPVQPPGCSPTSCPPPICSEVCDLPILTPLETVSAATRPYYEAMIEAMDTEIGRLIAGVDLNKTTVFILGDNGTPGSATADPFLGDRLLGIPPKSKGAIYQGGVNVPFIVAGAGVRGSRPGFPPRTTNKLVHVVDIYATIADLFGLDRPALGAISPNFFDSRSFKHILGRTVGQDRPFIFTERFAPNFPTSQAPCDLTLNRAIRNERYKLLRFTDIFDCSGPPIEELYDLSVDPYEEQDLMKTGEHQIPGVVQEAYLQLAAELDLIPLP